MSIDKIIFLDIDGVLNTHGSIMENVHLLPEKVKLIVLLCDMTGASVVISSAWREFMETDEIDGPLCPFRFAMRRAGFPVNRIIGRTGHNQTRGLEINEWLMAQTPQPQRWVIIDDEGHDFAGDPVQWSRFVRVDPVAGMTWENVKKAMKILNE